MKRKCEHCGGKMRAHYYREARCDNCLDSTDYMPCSKPSTSNERNRHKARCDKLEAALTTLIDDIYAVQAIAGGNGDYGPYLDLAQEHADEAKALLAEVQDG